MPNTNRQSIFIAITLFFLGALVYLTNSNQELFLSINHLGAQQPKWLWGNITLMGDTLMAFALLLILASIRPSAFTPSILLGIIGGILTHSLKNYFAIDRPPVILPAESFNLIGHRLEQGSFPSGHSFSALSVATLFAWQINKKYLTPFILLLGLGAGLSRIMVGAHWPLDVLVGSALGILTALLCIFISQKLPILSHNILLNLYAAFICMVVLSFPFYQSHYPNTIYLQVIASVVALCVAVCFYWFPKYSGKNKLKIQ